MWYVFVGACELDGDHPGNIRFGYEVEFHNDGGTHFSAGQKFMIPLYFVTLLVMGGLASLFVILLGDHKKRQGGELHSIVIVLGVLVMVEVTHIFITIILWPLLSSPPRIGCSWIRFTRGDRYLTMHLQTDRD